MAGILSGLFPLLLVLCTPLSCFSQSTNNNPVDNSTYTSPNVTSLKVPGCGKNLNPIYKYLCDRRAVWGIVLETLASSGFLFSILLLLGLLIWAMMRCISSKHQRSGIGGMVASMSMFLFATAGIFAITFAFIIRLTPQTCPTRLFLFGVFFSLAFSCLLARCLALLGFAATRGWGEPAVALGLFVVQVIIATEWLMLVLLRDKKPCSYTPQEFVMLQIYVLCLLAVGLILSLHFCRRACCTYSYSYTGSTHQQSRQQAALLFLTLFLSVCIWVVWITMMTWGNPEVRRRPQWDDPVLSIALVTNGWVLLLCHGLIQVAFVCRGEANAKDAPLSFAGWTSPSADVSGLESPREGKENGSFENETENLRGRRTEQSLRSPYEPGLSMTVRA